MGRSPFCWPGTGGALVIRRNGSDPVGNRGIDTELASRARLLFVHPSQRRFDARVAAGERRDESMPSAGAISKACYGLTRREDQGVGPGLSGIIRV